MKALPYLAAIAIVVGGLLLTFGFFWGEPGAYNHPFGSFLAINLGGLFVFTASYTLISEYWLKKDFAQMISKSIDQKLQTIRLHESIVASGISEVFGHFSNETLLQRIEQARNVRMIVMRSSAFFRNNHGDLRERLAAGTLELEVCLPDPRNKNLMQILCKKYSDHPTADLLAGSIVQSVNTWLREQIWSKLGSPNQKSRLCVRFTSSCPLYSAYVFDDQEIWYIPYHQRIDPQQIPVFVYRGDVSELEIYEDIKAVLLSEVFDLSHELDTQEQARN